jgi:hypothetical protein
MSLLYKLYYMEYRFYTEDYRLSHRAATEQSNPTSNRPGAIQASRRNLHHSSPSHLHLLSSVRVAGIDHVFAGIVAR